jgi:hypothetical protein
MMDAIVAADAASNSTVATGSGIIFLWPRSSYTFCQHFWPKEGITTTQAPYLLSTCTASSVPSGFWM